MKAMLVLQKASICVLSGMLLCSVSANAQTSDILAKAAVTIGPEINGPAINEKAQNPFDFALQAAENQNKDRGQFRQQSKSFQQVERGKSIPRKTMALQYRKKFGGTSEQAQALRNTLIAKYGEPKSLRGQSHVWDVKNPSRGSGQADTVTIILKMGAAGGYELIMDRDRGEDGHATWAAPRIEPVTPKQKQQETVQFKPVLQPDND